MTLTVPWVYVELSIGIAVCVAAGAVIGVVGTLLRIVVEGRRAEDQDAT